MSLGHGMNKRSLEDMRKGGGGKEGEASLPPPPRRSGNASSLLSSITSSISATSKSTLSARQAMINIAGQDMSMLGNRPIIGDEHSSAPDVAIANFIESLREEIESKGLGADVELEIRLGTIVSKMTDLRYDSKSHGIDLAIELSEEQMKALGATFVPGVQENDFQNYQRTCEKRYGTSHHQPSTLSSSSYGKMQIKQIVYTYPGSQRYIVDIDERTGQKVACYSQIKQRLKSLNIFLPKCSYDIRISLSLEFPQQEVELGTLEGLASPETERHRNRTSFVGSDLQVDLTQVTDAIRGNKIYEVEVENNVTKMQQWLNVPNTALAWKSSIEMSNRLWNAIKVILPSTGQAFKTTWRIKGGDAARATYQQLFQHKSSSNSNFPGTMPCGFARWHIPFVKTREYWVSEKTDGVRYFLVIASDAAILVDRTNSPFVTTGLEMLPSIFPEGTVLDGEFVLHQREQKYIFMVFDILSTGASISGTHVDKVFAERLRIMNEFLSDEGPYAQALRSGVDPSSIVPLLRKKWLPARHVVSIFKNIQKVKLRDSTIARVYSDDKREHFTDGVVFCPNTDYVCGSHKEYLKWKWSDLITIDFRADLRPDASIHLSCVGPGSTSIDLDSTIVMDAKDKPTIRGILEKIPTGWAIMEFAFVLETGCWQFKCQRPDKDRANYINTVLGSLVNMAEGISEEELQFLLTSSQSTSDEWNDQMKHMRRNILQNRLTQSSGSNGSNNIGSSGGLR